MSTTRLDQLKSEVTALTGRNTQPALAHGRQGRLDRGRSADEPQQIPPSGWKDVLVRSWGEVSDNNIFLVSGGVTYAILLALFPALPPWCRSTA